MNKEIIPYRFSREIHLHEFFKDGIWKKLTGTTTVLGVIAKPALIQWAANQAVEYIEANVTVEGLETVIVPLSVLKEARTAHRLKKEKAGEWGIDVHAWIEKWIKSLLSGSEAIKPLEDKIKNQVCNHFLNWVMNNNVVFKESEKNVYSENMWLGGIVDVVCMIDNQLWIVDIKTGSGIYPEAFWQMAAYDMCLSEMGLYSGITGYIVLNLKKDGTFEEKRSVSNEENREAFKAALTIYRIQEKIKNQII